MKLSVKSDYAARAVLALARRFPSGATERVEHIAAEQGVSANYLVQILIELKAQGIVRSVRGQHGGYLLARAPSAISLGDVLRCIHGEVFDTPALQDPNCPTELRNAWEQMRKSAEETANRINFQQLLDQATDKEKMYYI